MGWRTTLVTAQWRPPAWRPRVTGSHSGPGAGSTGPLPEGSVNLMAYLMHTGRHPSYGQGFSTRVLGDTTQEMEKIKTTCLLFIFRCPEPALELPTKHWQI